MERCVIHIHSRQAAIDSEYTPPLDQLVLLQSYLDAGTNRHRRRTLQLRMDTTVQSCEMCCSQIEFRSVCVTHDLQRRLMYMIPHLE